MGEAFRPVVPLWLVRGTYGISWLYVFGDVAWEGYKDNERGGNVPRTVVKRTIFQSIASMALPALTIHQTGRYFYLVVHVSDKQHPPLVHLFSMVLNKVGRFRKWGPTIAGLSVVPALPYLYDHPVEHAVDWTFDKVWPEKEGETTHHKEQ